MCKDAGFNKAFDDTATMFNKVCEFFDNLEENEELELCPDVRAYIRTMAVDSLGPAMTNILTTIAYSAAIREAEEELTLIDPRRN